MKKILILVLLIIFISGCGFGCSGTYFNDKHFCHRCHGLSCAIEEYSSHTDCIQCHALDICKRGNDWKTRVLNSKSKRSKKSRNRGRSRGEGSW